MGFLRKGLPLEDIVIAIAIIGAGVFFQPAIASMASGIGACIDFTSGTPCEPF